MDDTVQYSADSLLRSRTAPLLYVIDARANVLFASAFDDAEFSRGLEETLRSIAATMSTRAGPAPLTYNGWLVRTERLVSSGGGEYYAVFFERVALSKESPATSTLLVTDPEKASS